MKTLAEVKAKGHNDNGQGFSTQKVDTDLTMEIPNPRVVNLPNGVSVKILHCHGLLIPLFPFPSDDLKVKAVYALPIYKVGPQVKMLVSLEFYRNL